MKKREKVINICKSNIQISFRSILKGRFPWFNRKGMMNEKSSAVTSPSRSIRKTNPIIPNNNNNSNNNNNHGFVTNDDSDTVDDDDKRYMDRNTFAKELAQILREQEDAAVSKMNTNNDDNDSCSTTSTTNKTILENIDTILYNTYQILCHDDPIDITIIGGRALINALVQNTSTTSSTDTSKSKSKITTTTTIYAISNRLVNGIGQKCTSTVTKPAATAAAAVVVGKTSASSSSSDNSNDIAVVDKEEDSLLRSDATTKTKTKATDTLASIYSLLAFTVHIRIPLQCIISNNSLYTCQQLVGSFIVPTTNEKEGYDDGDGTGTGTTPINETQQQNVDDFINRHQHQQQQQEQEIEVVTNGHKHNDIEENGHYNATTVVTNSNDTDSVQEIWATESDPSDYEYESEYNIKQQLNELDTWIEQIQSYYNPILLSKQQTTMTWIAISQIISYLLTNVSYTKLSSITIQQWKNYKISDTMIQLILYLLLPNQQKQLLIFSSYPQNIGQQKQHWQKLGIQLLNIFRDATLEHINNINYNNILLKPSFVLIDFLQLSCTLLKAYDTNNNSNLTSNNFNHQNYLKYNDIPPATWIGLSSLSSICIEVSQMMSSSSLSSTTTTKRPQQQQQSSYYTSVQTIQSIIEQNCDELNLLLELSMKQQQQQQQQQTKKDDTAVTTTTTNESLRAIQWSYISFFQILAQPTTSTTTILTSSIPNSRCQIILNSGIFRQLLLCWESLHTSTLLPLMSSNGSESNSATTIPVNGTTSSLDLSIYLSIEDVIFDLCIGSTNLLGKYAWRYPKFANIVTTQDKKGSAVTTNDSTDDKINPIQQGMTTSSNDSHTIFVYQCRAFVWNLFGIQLSESNTTTTNVVKATPTIKWKNNNTTSLIKTDVAPTVVPITVQSCTINTKRLFQCICQKVLEIITDWKLRLEHHIDITSKINEQKMILNAFDTIVTTKLTSIILLRQIFYVVMSQHQQQQQQQQQQPDPNNAALKHIPNNTTIIPVELQSIRTLIQNWPQSLNSLSNKKKKYHCKDDNDNNDVTTDKDDDVEDNVKDSHDDDKNDQEKIIAKDKNKQYYIDIDICISRTRKVIKLLLSLLEEQEDINQAKMTTYRSISSKAD